MVLSKLFDNPDHLCKTFGDVRCHDNTKEHNERTECPLNIAPRMKITKTYRRQRCECIVGHCCEILTDTVCVQTEVEDEVLLMLVVIGQALEVQVCLPLKEY